MFMLALYVECWLNIYLYTNEYYLATANPNLQMKKKEKKNHESLCVYFVTYFVCHLQLPAVATLRFCHCCRRRRHVKL